MFWGSGSGVTRGGLGRSGGVRAARKGHPGRLGQETINVPNTLSPQAVVGGLTPLRGTTAARPSFFLGNLGEDFFVFVDFCDICNMGGPRMAPRWPQDGPKMAYFDFIEK